MRIGNIPDEEPEEELPLEVQLWISRGWTVIPTERRGIVLSGQKEMKGRTKFLILLGIILLALVFAPFSKIWPLLGAAFLVVAVLDYKFATQPPTKFFPADGEKKRSMERG
jgi:hypothetical protein